MLSQVKRPEVGAATEQVCVVRGGVCDELAGGAITLSLLVSRSSSLPDLGSAPGAPVRVQL